MAVILFGIIDLQDKTPKGSIAIQGCKVEIKEGGYDSTDLPPEATNAATASAIVATSPISSPLSSPRANSVNKCNQVEDSSTKEAHNLINENTSQKKAATTSTGAIIATSTMQSSTSTSTSIICGCPGE